VSTKFLFFVADGKSKMASIFQISLPSDPMGIVLKHLYQNSICYSQFSWNFNVSYFWKWYSYYPEKHCTSYLAGYLLDKNFLGPIIIISRKYIRIWSLVLVIILEPLKILTWFKRQFLSFSKLFLMG
jgi:hypothetical protein